MTESPNTLSEGGTDRAALKSPEDVLSALRLERGSALLDLDETLYLRNSTEDFIDCARPALLASILLRIVDLLKPWRFTGGLATRDVWRTAIIMLLFPWTMWVWKKRCKRLGQEFSNHELIATLRSSQATATVLTVGFKPIVRPLLAAMGLSDLPLVAARWFMLNDRRNGKLVMAQNALGAESVKAALVITDSTDDLPLLAVCAKPCRVLWPKAAFVPAFSGVWLPGQYISRVKRPGARYIRRGILQEDFAFWVLSAACLVFSGAPSIGHWAFNASVLLGALSLLLLSFWCIYELGYADNDRVAEKFETNPKLTPEYWSTRISTSPLPAWIWAMVSGTLGVWLFETYLQLGDFVSNLIKWLAVLVAVAALFSLYNRCDKGTRVWLYIWLQLARSAAFVVIVPVSLIGAAALAAHTLSRWVPYYIYRVTRQSDWPEAHADTVRLLFFAILSVLVYVSSGLDAILNPSGIALLLWCCYRARHGMVMIARDARRIDRISRPSASKPAAEPTGDPR